MEYNKEGYIHHGKMMGFYIKIVPDTEISGGFYVLYSKDFRTKSAEGYDEWYPDLKNINRLINELEINWEN